MAADPIALLENRALHERRDDVREAREDREVIDCVDVRGHARRDQGAHDAAAVHERRCDSRSDAGLQDRTLAGLRRETWIGLEVGRHDRRTTEHFGDAPVADGMARARRADVRVVALVQRTERARLFGEDREARLVLGEARDDEPVVRYPGAQESRKIVEKRARVDLLAQRTSQRGERVQDSRFERGGHVHEAGRGDGNGNSLRDRS